MKFYKNIRLSNWFGYIFSLFIAVSIIIFSNKKVQELKEEEVVKVKNYAETLELLNTDMHIPSETQSFLVDLIAQNTTIPVILVDENKVYLDSKNVEPNIIANPRKLKKELERMAEFYQPIAIALPFGTQYIYYKNSVLLNQLAYYPVILVILIILYVWFTFWYFKTLKKTEQSFLWAGMAKETAHQLGTPLSSIMGWLEILKFEEIDQKPINQIEKDVKRLLNITDRFSKIGSVSVLLQEEDLINTIYQSIKYLKNRVSKQIKFNIEEPETSIVLQLNVSLISWVIENLVKNAVDSMKNQGTITIKVQENVKNVFIDISDEGIGIPSKNLKKIFKPGFTTKKRGWGLGLSLAKRIIEEYHHGKIFVLNSETNKGTTFRIILKK